MSWPPQSLSSIMDHGIDRDSAGPTNAPEAGLEAVALASLVPAGPVSVGGGRHRTVEAIPWASLYTTWQISVRHSACGKPSVPRLQFRSPMSTFSGQSSSRPRAERSCEPRMPR